MKMGRKKLFRALIAPSFFVLAVLLFGCGAAPNIKNIQSVAVNAAKKVDVDSLLVADAYDVHQASTSYLLDVHFKAENGFSFETGMAVSIDYHEESKRCLLLTNSHVIKNDQENRRIYIRKWSGKDASFNGVVEWQSTEDDVAVISYKSDMKCQFSNMANYLPKLAVDIYALGQPLRGKRGVITSGIVSAYWEVENKHLLISDIFSTKGFSGGGVFLSNTNELVGLMQGKTKENAFSYIIPTAIIKHTIEHQLRTIKAKYDSIKKYLSCAMARLCFF